MLNDKLNALNRYPFHMPGHKRNKRFEITGSEIDVTEITGLDDLHNPAADIYELENKISRLWNSKRSIISVNGSTCGVLAAISAVSTENATVIIARNCHKSVYNACYINKLKIAYIEPEYNEEFGVYGSVTQKALDDAVKRNPNACAAVITSPTYEGITSDIVCKIPLIIDAAHGAHFGFAPWLPERANGDIVVQSLHKTLPSLTQTAVIHINNEKYINAVKKYMDIYETSSASYILLASIEKCCVFLENSGDDFNRYRLMLESFYKKASGIDKLKIMDNDDKTRIVISYDGMNAGRLFDELLKNGIEPEGKSLKYVILISSVADTEDGFEKLIEALKKIKPDSSPDAFDFMKPDIPQKHCELYEIGKTEICKINESIGRCCAQMIYTYPPASPIIAPGEIISREIIDYIKLCHDKGINIIDSNNLLPQFILTKALR